CEVKDRKVSRKDAKTQGIRGKGIRRRRAKAHAPMTFRMSSFPTFHMPHATCRPNIEPPHIPYATCDLSPEYRASPHSVCHMPPAPRISGSPTFRTPH